MKHFFTRFFHMIIGFVFYAFGIVLTINANIGYAPWDVFHVGLANTTGLSIGLASILTGLVIVLIVTILREKLGLGTILNMLIIGLFLDILFMTKIIPVAENPVTGIIMLIGGLFIISIGSYFYIKSAFGAGPRDNLMVVLVRRTKLPVGLCRFAIELSITIIGWFLGGMVGFGTIICVIGIGLCIQTTFKILKFDVTAVKHETLRETFTKLRKRYREDAEP